MTHTVSLLCWLSAGLSNLWVLISGSTKLTTPWPASGYLCYNVQQAVTRLSSRRLWVWLARLVNSRLNSSWTQAEAILLQPLTTLHQLSRGLLSHYSYDSARVLSLAPPPPHRLPPPTQQGFAEPLLQNLPPPTQQGFAELQLLWLSGQRWVKLYTVCTQQGDSVLEWLSLLHKLSKDLLSLPWTLMYNQ